eukprot:3764535-Prymnesium_polylepis.1
MATLARGDSDRGGDSLTAIVSTTRRWSVVSGERERLRLLDRERERLLEREYRSGIGQGAVGTEVGRCQR